MFLEGQIKDGRGLKGNRKVLYTGYCCDVPDRKRAFPIHFYVKQSFGNGGK